MSKFRQFSANRQGRDFICADIHGYFDLLEQKLMSCHFDPAVDRLFSLGDLIDRGPMSELALEYIGYDWFYPILGNHELMLMDAFESKSADVFQRWCYWGGEWAQTLDNEQIHQYYQAFLKLPIAIEIALQDERRVGLVHAEVPAGVSWQTIRENLTNMPEGTFDLHDRFINPLIWSKNLFLDITEAGLKVSPVAGIDHVFHGHSIVDLEPLTFGNRTYMDLGSYESGNIGLINLSSP